MAIGDQGWYPANGSGNWYKPRCAGFKQADGHVVDNVGVQENIVLCEGTPLGLGEHVTGELNLRINS